MSLRDEIRAENKKNFENMNFPQKVKHFWHYYKFHVLVTLAVIAFIIYIILLNTVLKDKPYAFAVYALNTNFYTVEDYNKGDAFINEFATLEGINTEEYQVEFNVSNAFDPTSANTTDMAIDMKLTAIGSDGEMDIIIGSAAQIDSYIKNGFYQQSIDKLIPEDMFQELDTAGLIYYYYDEDSNQEYPIGIYISDAPRIKELGLYDEDAEVVLGIVTLSERIETSVNFIRYIFETPETEN